MTVRTQTAFINRVTRIRSSLKILSKMPPGEAVAEAVAAKRVEDDGVDVSTALSV